ncbi:MAG: MltA domain-containing protein [Elusimicrobia bacterium]|nr:MltA domain-containing protein [Elusimicrobiota bacterium]
MRPISLSFAVLFPASAVFAAEPGSPSSERGPSAAVEAVVAPVAVPAADWPPEVPHWARFHSADPAASSAGRSGIECPPGSPRRRPVFSGSVEPSFEIKELKPWAEVPLPQDDLSAASAVEAAGKTRDYWAGRPPEEKVVIGGRTYSAAHMARSFSALGSLLSRALSAAALKAEIEKAFDIYQAVKPDGTLEGTMTAYYDPEIPVGRVGSTGVPIHARPSDLVRVDPSLGLPFDYGRVDSQGKLVPHAARREVNAGALAEQGLELYATRHPTDLLNLQTEGSGWGVLPGGGRVRLIFNGTNGHPFRSVGKTLIDCGLIPAGTDSFGILNYLKSQTLEREIELVDVNPRYVFFKEVASTGGPWGATGVELVAGRSVASDPKQVRLGLAGILVSRKPVASEDGTFQGFLDFTRFVFTHDVGSAIRGPVRLDVFWGRGAKAEAEAHRMLFPGKLTVIVLKQP